MIHGAEERSHRLQIPPPTDTITIHEDPTVIRLLNLEEPNLYFVTVPTNNPSKAGKLPLKTPTRPTKSSSTPLDPSGGVHRSLSTAFTLQYLNKGAANAVFNILPASVGSSAATFISVTQLVHTKQGLTARIVPPHKAVLGKVLRVPRGKARTLSGDTIVSEFHKIIKPMFQSAKSVPRSPAPNADFTKHLMDHQGVLLFPSVVTTLCSLADHDVFTKHVDQSQMCWGVLLEDMSPVHGSSIVMEIKPKWLLQSPNAPPRAKRCRTCATQINAPKKRATYICPLRLINTDADGLRPWLRTILADLSNQIPKPYPSPDFTHRIAEHLLADFTNGQVHALLQHLRMLQAKLDPGGVLAQLPLTDEPTAANFDLRAAMTLRDCSLFIKVEYDHITGTPSAITAKLGDLDFKSAEKTADWADKELRLLSDGMYTRDLRDDFGCWLST